MRNLITLVLLTISLGALSQVLVVNIAVKESNVQGWAEVEWQKCTNTRIDVYATYLLILSDDTLTIAFNSKPFEYMDGMFITDGTIVSTGEMLRLKFVFGEDGLSQVYLLTVPKASGFYLSKQMIVSIEGKIHPIELLYSRTSHWDIVMQLAPNDLSVY